MPDRENPISLQCSICGGRIVNDYLEAACVCAHCGNRWSMDELLPDYKDYARAVEQVGKANELLERKPDVVSAGQAKLMFQRAEEDCADRPDAIALEIMKSCQEGKELADRIIIYAKGKKSFDNKDYHQAITEFSKIPGFKDVDELVKQCNIGIENTREKRVPFTLILGLVLPIAICELILQLTGLHILIIIPIFLLLCGALAYVVFFEKVPPLLIEILSLVIAMPLAIFMILVHGFHMETKTAILIAVLAPLAVSAVFFAIPDITKKGSGK